MQIEMLRGDISYEELSQRLGPEMERCLARYVAGKTHLNEDDFVTIAKALSIEARILVRTWGTSLGLHLPNKGAVRWMLQRAYRDWRLHSHLPERCVPHNPSPMAIIRAKYAGRLPRQTPLLWSKSHDCGEDTPEGREKFARGYEMLIQFVHDRQSQRDIGARHGLSGARAAQLMRYAAYTWSDNEGIDLIHDKSVPFKNDDKLVKNLYAGLRFFAQQQFDMLTVKDRCYETKTES